MYVTILNHKSILSVCPGAVNAILDSLEEIQCLTDCGDRDMDLLYSVFDDTQLHSLLNVSTCNFLLLLSSETSVLKIAVFLFWFPELPQSNQSNRTKQLKLYFFIAAQIA